MADRAQPSPEEIERLAAKLLDQLRKANQYVHCDLVTDAKGLAYLCDASPDSVRKWRAKGYGPETMELVKGRPVYEFGDIAAWMLSTKK